MKQNYTTQLVGSLSTLESMRNQLFDKVINLGMYGTYSDINDVLEPGDSYQFELDHFDNSDDSSLQALVDLMKMIDLTSKKVLRINDLAPDSVEV